MSVDRYLATTYLTRYMTSGRVYVKRCIAMVLVSGILHVVMTFIASIISGTYEKPCSPVCVHNTGFLNGTTLAQLLSFCDEFAVAPSAV